MNTAKIQLEFIAGFNRTIIELKLELGKVIKGANVGFNRTIIELKFIKPNHHL